MTCAICSGTGEMLVRVSEPDDPTRVHAYRACVCGTMKSEPVPTGAGVSSNMTLEGREIDIAKWFKPSKTPGLIDCYDEGEADEKISHLKLLGIDEDDGA